MSTYVMEIIACSLIMIIFYFILKVKKYDFVDSIKLNKITLRSALPFILLGLSVYFIFIILLNCIPFFQGEDTVSNTNDLHKSVNGINVVFVCSQEYISSNCRGGYISWLNLFKTKIGFSNMGIITFSFVDFWCYSFFIIYIHSIVSNFIEFDF